MGAAATSAPCWSGLALLCHPPAWPSAPQPQRQPQVPSCPGRGQEVVSRVGDASAKWQIASLDAAAGPPHPVPSTEQSEEAPPPLHAPLHALPLHRLPFSLLATSCLRPHGTRWQELLSGCVWRWVSQPPGGGSCRPHLLECGPGGVPLI